MSPFPIKIAIPDAFARIYWGDVSEDVRNSMIEMNPRLAELSIDSKYMVYKNEVFHVWCNLVLGPRAWDFEDNQRPDSFEEGVFKYKICFHNEQDATLFRLRWL